MIDLPCIVEVRRNADGVVRRYQNEDTNFRGDFIWSEGNYSCDCNRALFFAWANGEDDDPPHECGRSAFAVRITSKDGKVLYQDGEGWV